MNHSVSLPCAEVTINADGTPYSPAYGDVYHAAGGATAQARHVFLAGNGLPARWQGRARFTILETGFGLGLNFLEAWRALDDDPHAPQALHFVSVESHPVAREMLAALHARWPEHAARSRELLAAWPLPIAGFHRFHFAGGRVVLTLLLGEAGELLPQLEARADAFFLDGFAPDRNPQLWSRDIFAELARLAAPDATLATWSVAAAVREELAAAGFAVTRRPGVSGKGEILAGHRVGAGTAPASTGHPERSAIIIGAGIAGCAVAERLAARGWQVQVLERHAAPAQEASGNPLALASPLVNFADETNAQLSRAAFLFAQRWYAAIGCVPSGAAAGVLRIARHERDAQRFAQLLERLAYPREFAAWADVPEGARLAGHAVSRAGMWFPGGMSIAPATACALALARWPQRIVLRSGVEAASFEATSLDAMAGGWRVLDPQGQPLASASVVILAGGTGLQRFPAAAGLPLESIRGQVTLLPPDPRRRLAVAVSGDRHAVMLPDGGCMIGATFQPGDDDDAVRAADHSDNLRSVDDMLPGFGAGIDPEGAGITGRTGFRAVTPDRLPIYGALDAPAGDGPAAGRATAPSSSPTLFIAGGLGARGVVWAPLGAELIAAQLDGEPLPLPRALAKAMNPARFARHKP